MARITFKAAALLAARLELDLDDTPICLACLSFVSLPLGSGDEREARSWTRRMTYDIWHEGLEQPAMLSSVVRARTGFRTPRRLSPTLPSAAGAAWPRRGSCGIWRATWPRGLGASC